MKINHNIAALNAYRNLATNNTNTAKSLEKLSSGLRINRAADDAAGLAISEKMRSQIRGLDMAGRNALDGISFIQTAEGALSSTHDILQRMRELAVQAANGTNTDTDRAAIQEEINQMTNEINRIGNTTEFNTQKLLDGSKTLGGATTITAGVKGVAAVTAVAGDYKITLSAAFADGDKITIDGQTFTATSTVGGTNAGTGTFEQDSQTNQATNLKTVIDGNATLAAKYSVAVSGNDITLKQKAGQESATTPVVSDTGALANATLSTTTSGVTGVTGVTAVPGVYELQTGTQDIIIDGKTFAYDANGTKDWKDVNTLVAAINADGTLGTNYSASVVNGEIQLTQQTGKESATAPVVTGNDNSVSLQIGANDGQSISINISDMRAAALGLTGTGAGFTITKDVNNGTASTGVESGLDVSNANNAASAITIIQKAIESVSAERSRMGAIQNRLEHTVDNLKYMGENVTASESRIRDLDMALEMTAYTKNNILVQSAQAMLAQANQLPQGVLQLLK